jgi:hypothetical protein
MEKVFLISDFSNKIKRLAESLQIPVTNIISYQTKENESGYHNWLNNEFESKEINKIIIPVSISNDGTINTEGLLLGLHIRLNYELPLEKRLVPIIFASNFTVENLIKKNHFDSDNNSQNLIFTKGVYFSSFDLEDMLKTVETAISCPKMEYHRNVLSKLNINKKDDFGGHDIANAWGCFKVAQVMGIDDKIFQLDSIAKHLKQLYAKYLICKNETFSSEKRIDLNPIKCSGKNILFIDDKADEGWALLMKNLFKGAEGNFIYVDSSKYKADDSHKSFKDFDGFYKECQSHIGKDWDLIIIDLRLNPEKEDIDNEMIVPTAFSGYKLIDEFLSINEGYQIIVSTASNKIWNINATIERGASTFYIKESPEFNYSISETNKHYENFKNDVTKCFEHSYLKGFYYKIQEVKKIIDSQNPQVSNKIKEFYERTSDNLLVAFELLKSSRKNKKYRNYGYLQLFQIIEDFIKLNEVFEDAASCYVTCKGNRVLVLELTESTERKKIYKSSIEFIESKYEINESTFDKRIDTYLKVSSLLIYRYGFDNSNPANLNWNTINYNRNNKAAHGGDTNIVSTNDITQLFDFMIFILDDSNQKESNIAKGLAESSYEDKLEQLKQKFDK